MGIFDMVWVDCPHCGKPVEFQSKAMEDAYMRRFTLDNAPVAVLLDVMNDPNYCESCDKWFALIDPEYPPGQEPRPALRPAKVKTPDNPETHPQGMKWWPEDRPFSYADLADDAVLKSTNS